MNGRFAGGSMVRFLSFSQNICTECKCFVKKKGIFRPAGGDMLCQVSNHITRVNDTSYAVVHQTGRFTR